MYSSQNLLILEIAKAAFRGCFFYVIFINIIFRINSLPLPFLQRTIMCKGAGLAGNAGFTNHFLPGFVNYVEPN
ncbi:hypothetical protein D770_06085 [Flammeovirgaceae bacterium 311]|nr:hypothetical protein D770_06085 [Flammeovirgaceae bacterium 311]